MITITLPLFHIVLHDCSMISFCSMFFFWFPNIIMPHGQRWCTHNKCGCRHKKMRQWWCRHMNLSMNDKVGQGFCGARNGWLRISATMCSMQRVFFSTAILYTSSYRANWFTYISKEITNDKNLARSLNLSSSIMFQSIQFILVSCLSHPNMITCRETILFVEVVVSLEHILDALWSLLG